MTGNRDESDSGAREPTQAEAGVRFQPADPADLERHPPRDEVCRGIREMLRDHCDGDLAAPERRRVDDHAHACRDCALALSRMELETLRLRQAFAAERAAMATVPGDLVSGVMGRIGEILLEDAETPPQFTNRVMERVRREWQRPPLWRRVFGEGHGARWVAAAAVLLVIAGAIGIGSWYGLADRREAGYELVTAVDAVVTSPAGGRRVADPGARLGAGEQVLTGGDGAAVLAFVGGDADAAGARVPTARQGTRLELDADGALGVLPAGGVALLSGTVLVETNERYQLSLADTAPGDGALVVLDPLAAGASALISVEPVRRYDAALAMTDVHRVRLEVTAGRARVLRGTLDAVVVGEGEVARFDGWSTVEVGPAPSDRLVARSARAGRSPAIAGVAGPNAASGSESWTGQVIDMTTGRGIELASVEIRIGDRAVERTRTVKDGWFHFTSPNAAVATAVVRVLPPSTPDAEWAAFGPEPIRLESRGRDRRQLQPISLRPDVPVQGVVLHGVRGRIADARIVPCVVDELFAMFERIEPLAVRTDADGAFTLRGLPTDLPRHQTLALVVEESGLPRHVRLDLGGRRSDSLAARLEILLPDAREVTVENLTPGAQVRVLRELPGVPLTAMAEEFVEVADAAGRAVLRDVGPGTLWMVGESGDELLRLGSGLDDTLVTVAPEATRDWPGVDRMWSQARSFADRGAPGIVAAVGRRLDVVAPPPAPQEARQVLVQDESGLSGIVAARLFLERADGSVQFLGEVDGPYPLPFAPPPVDQRPFRIVAIAANGAVGVLTSEDIEQKRMQIRMQAPGAATLGEELRAVVQNGDMIAFDLLDGPHAGRRFWRLADAQRDLRIDDLPAGTYSVVLPGGGRWTCTITPGGSSSIAREAAEVSSEASGR